MLPVHPPSWIHDAPVRVEYVAGMRPLTARPVGAYAHPLR